MNEFLNKIDYYNLKLDFFIGKEFMLSGFDRVDGDYSNGHADEIIFILNNETYKAKEDENDGYRSSLGYVSKTNDVCKNTFSSHKVKTRWKSNVYEENHTIEFVDVISGRPVLEIGTDNWDDYYPCCRLNFMCDNLAINCENDKYVRWQREYKLERIIK